MSNVLIERTLDYFGESGIEHGVVQAFAPEQDDRSWRCDYRIAWPGHEWKSRALGADAWQALHLAMFIVPTMISSTHDFKEGRIGLWGEPVTTYEGICELFDVKPVEGPTQ